MKRLITALLALWSMTTMAGLPPTTLGGVSGTASTTFNFKVPNQQATPITGAGRIETGNSNLLADPSFEKAVLSDWSCSLGTKSTNTANKTDGAQSLSIVSAGAGIRCQQVSTINAASLKGLQMVARIAINSTDSALQACAVIDGTDTNCVTIPVTTTANPFQTIEIPFIAGGTSNGIAIKSTTTTVQNIYADEAFVGKATPLASVNTATDWIAYTPTFTGFGTPSPIEAQYKRIGDSIAIKMRFTTTAHTGVEARVSLPSGLTTTAFTGIRATGGPIGYSTNQNVNAMNALIEPSVTYLTFGYQQGTTNFPLTKRLANDITAGTFTIETGLIPVSGWSSGAANVYASPIISQYHTLEFTNGTSTWSSSPANVSVLGTKTGETGAGLLSIAGDSTVGTRITALKPIIVDIGASAAALNSSQFYIMKNGTTAMSVTGPSIALGGNVYFSASAHVKLATGDYITFERSSANMTSINAVTIKAVDANNYLYGTFVGIPSVPGATSGVDTFSVGYGATASTVCSAANTTCAYNNAIGSASVARGASAGLYTLTAPRTYSKINCTANVVASGSGVAHVYSPLSCTNCSTLAISTQSGAGAAADTLGTIDCKGTY